MKFFLPISAANFIAKILEKKAKKTGEKPLMTTFSVYNLARNEIVNNSWHIFYKDFVPYAAASNAA